MTVKACDGGARAGRTRPEVGLDTLRRGQPESKNSGAAGQAARIVNRPSRRAWDRSQAAPWPRRAG
jgi:hypothetical protein